MREPIKCESLEIGQQFFDEETDTTPYTVIKIDRGRVYSNSLVDKDSLIKLPKGYTVYID